MVVNVYVNRDSKNEIVKTKVDESTSHKLGDEVDLDGISYKVMEIKHEEFYDYMTVLHTNYLVINKDVENVL